MDKKVPRKGRKMKPIPPNNRDNYELQFKVQEDAVEKRKVKESDVFDKRSKGQSPKKPKKNYKKSRPIKKRLSKKNQ
jgi:hypothetical protein